jgi:hypothetical protein
MSRSLDDLAPEFRPLAFELFARLNAEISPFMVIDTLRTPAEQEENLRRGVSATLRSKHLPQPPSGLSLAIDVCPWEVWQATGPDKLQWNAGDPRWQLAAAIGKRLGLRWGGDWYYPNNPLYFAGPQHGEWRNPATVRPYDPGHFEFIG